MAFTLIDSPFYLRAAEAEDAREPAGTQRLGSQSRVVDVVYQGRDRRYLVSCRAYGIGTSHEIRSSLRQPLFSADGRQTTRQTANAEYALDRV